MGILREDEKPKNFRIEEVAPITYADYVFDDSSDDEIVVVTVERCEEDEELPPVNPIHRLEYEQRWKRRNEKYNSKKAARDANKLILGGNLEIKKHMGAHKWRRVENARLLAQFVDPSDIRYDCSDLIDETVSAFARLMQNEESMRVWNEFIEKDEKEQEAFLRELDNEFPDEHNDFFMVESDEKRSCHPAYSAKTCFQNMDKKFKTALSKKSGVRLDMINELESAFRKFFAANPHGIWSDRIISERKRFYLDAVAQYLMLESRSQQNSNRGLITEVYNPKKKFEPPNESLHSYLHARINRKL